MLPWLSIPTAICSRYRSSSCSWMTIQTQSERPGYLTSSFHRTRAIATVCFIDFACYPLYRLDSKLSLLMLPHQGRPNQCRRLITLYIRSLQIEVNQPFIVILVQILMLQHERILMVYLNPFGTYKCTCNGVPLVDSCIASTIRVVQPNRCGAGPNQRRVLSSNFMHRSRNSGKPALYCASV